eukprot:4643257-Amphidinium_carterae.2
MEIDLVMLEFQMGSSATRGDTEKGEDHGALHHTTRERTRHVVSTRMMSTSSIHAKRHRPETRLVQLPH